jgi:hypothetical protein
MNAHAPFPDQDEPTEVMNRLPFPVSGVMPISRPPPVESLPPIAESLHPPTSRRSRVQSELRQYQVLAGVLAIALAFVSGLLFVMLTRGERPPARAARDASDRVNTLETHSVTERSTLAAKPTASAAPRATQAPRRRPVSPERRAITQPAAEEDLGGRDLLGEGLGTR